MKQPLHQLTETQLTEIRTQMLKFATLQLKLHLMMCPRCRAFAKNCEKVEQMMKEFSTVSDK